MESLNVKNINDEKIFNVIDPNGQGEVVNRIRPISISINQKAETINDQTDSTINLAVYWNDTWKSILDLTFDESLRQEYGKLTQDLTNIQKDIDMKQYKDAETKTNDFLKYVANLSSKYTAIPEKAVVSKIKNDFVKIKADKNSVKVAISDKLLNFMLKKYAKVDNLDYTKSNECFSTSKFNCLANNYDIYYHSPEIFQKQAYMTVVKDNKVVGSYKVNYDQFSKFASKFMLTPQKLGYSKDRLAGYMKTAEVVMQNIFFDSVDEAKEWQEMVDEKKKEQATTPEGEEETTETTTTETKTEMGEGKSESPIKEDGGLARPSEDFASDEIPESEPRQQEQQGGGQNLGASRRVKNVKKTAKVGYNAEPENELEEKAVKIGDEIMNVEWDFGEEIQNLEDILEENPKNKKVIEERISVLKGKRIEGIKKVVEKYNKEFANKEIADLVYEHLQDNNAHKANSIVLSIVNGKQASKKVKLNKKAGIDMNLSYGHFLKEEDENKLPKFNTLEDIKTYIKTNNKFPGNFFYKGGLFTEDEYDMDGMVVTYGSPEIDKSIIINTPDNRYNYKGNYKNLDMDIVEEDAPYFRTDVNYTLPKKVYEELFPKKNSNKNLKLNKKAGTGNFKTYADYPLVAIGDDSVLNKEDFVEQWNEDHTEEKISKWKEEEDTYYIWLDDNYGIVIDDMKRAINSKDTPYHKIGIESGYYEGLQLTVEEKDEDFYNDYDNDHWDEYSKYYDEGLDLPKEYTDKREQAWDQEKERVAQIMKDLAKEQGWGEYVVAYRMSNGETGYSRVNASRKAKRLNKKALYGDVQEQDIVPAKTETKVYLQSEKSEDFVWLINSSGRIEILAPKALVMGATGSGDNSEGVNKLRDYIKKDLEKISVEEMQKTVSEYGIDNVKEMDKDELERYLVWLLAGDTADNLENRLADEEDLENIKAKNNPNVQKQAEEQTVEEKIEQQVGEDGDVKATIGVGDVVTVNFDLIDNSTSEFEKYEEFIGKPMLLMETDKEDINKVIIEETEYPFQRLTIDTDKVELFDDMKGTEIVVEDTDGDEMITTFEELPVVAKQCKVKSIHKAANITKKKANLTKKAINSLEDVAGLIDDILSDYDWYDYADQLEVGEKSHYENILADLQKDEEGTIEALFNRVSENDEEYSSPKIEQLKEYYNNKFSNGGK